MPPNYTIFRYFANSLFNSMIIKALDGRLGREKDGTLNEEYCKWC